jgi:hypothetical protein
MAVLLKNDQQLYLGRGPLDAKSLVKTYADLTNLDTWTTDNVVTAYNGMLVAVWLNKEDSSKNGLYCLYDPNVTTALIPATAKPDVTKQENWVKLADIDSGIETIKALIGENESAIEAEELRAKEAENNIIAALETTKSEIISIIPALKVATADELGSIRSAVGDNKVTVADTGEAEVRTINVSTLVQTPGDVFKIDGGNSAN